MDIRNRGSGDAGLVECAPPGQLESSRCDGAPRAAGPPKQKNVVLVFAYRKSALCASAAKREPHEHRLVLGAEWAVGPAVLFPALSVDIPSSAPKLSRKIVHRWPFGIRVRERAEWKKRVIMGHSVRAAGVGAIRLLRFVIVGAKASVKARCEDPWPLVDTKTAAPQDFGRRWGRAELHDGRAAYDSHVALLAGIKSYAPKPFQLHDDGSCQGANAPPASSRSDDRNRRGSSRSTTAESTDSSD